MSVLSLGSFHSCCASPVHEGKDSELVVAEYTATKGSAVYQRPAFLPPPLPLYKEEHRLPLARVKPSRPLERHLGDTVVFEDCCFSDSVSRLSSFDGDHAVLEQVEGCEMPTQLPFSHLPPLDAPELAEFDVALASEVLESIQVLCEEYERFYAARRSLQWLEAYLQRHQKDTPEARHFSVSMEKDLCIARLRLKLEWLDSALERTRTDGISDGDCGGADKWLYEKLSSEKELWLKQDTDYMLTLKIQGILHNPTYHIISLIREVDLHPNWVPFLSGSWTDHVIEGCGRRCQMMVTHEYSVPIPFVPSRWASMYAFACDALDEPGVESIIIYGRGIPEDSKEFWGYSVPTMKGIRAELETLSFVMKPIDGGKSTSFTILAETNPKIHIPEKILGWLCKQYAKYIFHSIEKLSDNFESTEYPTRMEQNRDFYEFIETTVIGRIKSMHERGRSCHDKDDFVAS
ncbi:hypothetical protein Pmar_PMAR011174 [Perkinsus marinus ATCC 50983]|uniref:START domain-containing protein n=1 Tax=Perkinsus marinus (strain ATCC 50983 / TXsc) TaxID=423536 RepID=C5L1P3_PERM5|nr:hypothetical protein Pmar_PMAR011174 [Perkinsus marinus ATCC 50983]EER09355.1 hypothetical protein Pmar_PMAR011174 [Perkinsus marinus ATCC 50983]|eukprot:XP_002777539.1 hypothetical protein Pmar_PMAR011174 [Perkinsus marinus ATCC 50983]